jgi:nuclear RNA export factor
MVYGAKDLALESGRGRVALNPSKARFARTSILKVTGLSLTAPDKHLPSVLTFLERKASKDQTKRITINKVCFST